VTPSPMAATSATGPHGRHPRPELGTVTASPPSRMAARVSSPRAATVASSANATSPPHPWRPRCPSRHADAHPWPPRRPARPWATSPFCRHCHPRLPARPLAGVACQRDGTTGSPMSRANRTWTTLGRRIEPRQMRVAGHATDSERSFQSGGALVPTAWLHYAQTPGAQHPPCNPSTPSRTSRTGRPLVRRLDDDYVMCNTHDASHISRTRQSLVCCLVVTCGYVPVADLPVSIRDRGRACAGSRRVGGFRACSG
jgi:hypothetical protein